MTLKKILPLLLCSYLLPGLTGCAKDEVNTTPTQAQTWTAEIYANMKYIYLWNLALPTSFDPTQYTQADVAFKYLKSLKINPETNKAIDRYSFLDKIGNLSGELGTGVSSGDLGFMVGAGINAQNEVSFFVSYVYKNSPAGIAGVERGMEVTQVNGSTTVHPTTDNNGNLIQVSPGYVNMVNALWGGATASFEFKKENGTLLSTTLSPTTYKINSVLCDSIYDINNEKTAYLVFNQFLDTTAQTELTNAISRYEGANVKNLILDLRYNTGGIVRTCETLCNLLAPASAEGKIMYKYAFNDILTTEFATQGESTSTQFKKTNHFEPAKIFVITSGNTASASELLINNLKPYFPGTLYLIGKKTYGKPCGFWATPIGYTKTQTTPKEGYDMYAVSFETRNANNEGGYYSGMTPGSSQYPGVLAVDNLRYNWGDTRDECLMQAQYHIANLAFYSGPSQVKGIRTINETSFPDKRFRGMIDYRK